MEATELCTITFANTQFGVRRQVVELEVGT